MLTTAQNITQLGKKKNILIPNKNGDFKVVEGIKNKEELTRLTLRQLRQIASKLSVPLYSRKTKAVLIDLIITYQNKNILGDNVNQENNLKVEKYGDSSKQALVETQTNLVFLPRDPEWAYVFWQISETDRNKAQSLGCLLYTSPSPRD